MNTKEIQDIINFIKKTDLDDVSIETENYKIRVKKNSSSISEKVVHKSEKPKIKAGDIMFFSSNLFHGVSPHKNDIIRKTLSVNFNIRR